MMARLARRWRTDGADRDAMYQDDPGLSMAPFRQALDAEPHVENMVLRGLDGWLFLWTGTNRVHRLFTEPDAMPEARIDAWARLIEERAQRITALGAEFRQLIIPDKISIYPEYVPVALPYFDRHPARRIASRMQDNPTFVDLLGPLRGSDSSLTERRGAAMRGETPPAPAPLLYWQTDSHWSNEGCEIGYRTLCSSLGVVPRDFADRPCINQAQAVLDLGNKLDPVWREGRRLRMFLREGRRVAENAITRETESQARKATSRHVGSYVAWHNDSAKADPRRVVIFGDSFANYRTGLSVMLAETFREVHFVWALSLDHAFIEEIAPDIVIAETAERFMVRSPGDRFTLVRD